MMVDPKTTPILEFHQLLLSAVAPRPIAFASTVDQAGSVNLSPFSFFNCFSVNPPILAFSPTRRVRDNTVKHTLENVLEVPEVVINVVNYPLVYQASLSSTEYPKGENEFIKAGLTPVKSILVRPPRVKESPVSFECKVREVISLGKEAGGGQMVMAEILLVHVQEGLAYNHGKMDPHQLDLVARMGADYYCRASGTAVFEVEKPLIKKGMGVDQIPEKIRLSRVLTGNNLGQLGNVEQLPDQDEVEMIKKHPEVVELVAEGEPTQEQIHRLAKKWLDLGKVSEAWKLLMLNI